MIFLLTPLFLSLLSIFVSDKIYNIVIYEYINKIEIIDTSNLERISTAVQNVSTEKLMTSQLVNSLNLKVAKQNITLPPLENIIPPIGPLPQPAQSKRDFKVQAVYISDKTKFTVIDGKIYREGDSGNLFKVLKIDVNRVQIETVEKEKLWLSLD